MFLCFFSRGQKEEISQALSISYNSTFELFKKNKSHCHWNKSAFQDLMQHLNRRAKSHFVSQHSLSRFTVVDVNRYRTLIVVGNIQVPVMSSELETLVEDFKKLDQFLTQQVKNSANDTEQRKFRMCSYLHHLNLHRLTVTSLRQNMSCCAWETVRHDILVVMDHFRRMTRPRRRHV